MFYLGRVSMGLAYIALEFIAFALPFGAAHLGLPGDPDIIRTVLAGLVRAGGVVHCFLHARALDGRIRQNWLTRWYGFGGLLGAIVAGGLIVNWFVVETFSIASETMAPGLRAGDHFLVAKSAYGISRHSFPFPMPPVKGRFGGDSPRRGDIVAYRLPADPSTIFVQRIIGLPGDRISLEESIVHIGGRPVDLNSLSPFQISLPQGQIRTYIQRSEKLPGARPHRILELSDNGDNDDMDTVKVPEGHYFLMGDNRDRVLDSRNADKVGPIPAENIIGPVKWIIWNDRSRRLSFRQPGQ